MSKNYPDVLVNHIQESVKGGRNIDELATIFSESLKGSFNISTDKLFDELKYYIGEMYYYKNIRMIMGYLKELYNKYEGYDLTVFRNMINRKMSPNDIDSVFRYYDKKCLKHLLDKDLSYPVKHVMLDMLETQTDFDYPYALNKKSDNDTNIILLEMVAILNKQNKESRGFIITELEKIINDYK